jgi:hypothetical protein
MLEVPATVRVEDPTPVTKTFHALSKSPLHSVGLLGRSSSEDGPELALNKGRT